MAVLCAFLTAACGFDYYKQKIPNQLIVMMIAGALFVRWHRDGVFGGLACLGTMLLVVVFLYPFFQMGALGAGDVKLFGVTAGFLPFGKILYFSFFSLLIAAIFSVFKLWHRRSRDKNMTVCLSGPVLLGVLLLWGGVY